VAKRQTLTYRFVLSDEEFGSAWLREYYRRPGWKTWRVIGGPCFFALGLAMSTSGELLTKGVGIATALLGVWYGVKPFLARRLLTAQRRKAGHSDLQLELRLNREGIRIDDGNVRKQIPWSDVVRAGESKDYVWYELSGGSRATIPRRVIDDLDALRDELRENASWET